MKMPCPPPHYVPGCYIARMSSRCLCAFHFEQLRFDSARYAFGNFVLDSEHVGQFQIIAFGPDMLPRSRVDELSRNSYLLPGLAHAAFDQIFNAKLLRDLLCIKWSVLVGKAGIAGDDEKPTKPRQSSNDIFRNA